MKEKIYTIPLTESLEQDSECPFCYIEKKLEADAVNYALGAAMMEPDYRIVSNEKGYCNKHFSMMLAAPNKLSLALVLETHFNEVIESLEAKENCLNSNVKSSLFKSKNAISPSRCIAETTDKICSSCVICDKVNNHMERYIDTFFYLWEKESDFREKVKNSKGFCLEHFSKLCSKSENHLKNQNEFLREIYSLELNNLKRIYEDIHKFTLKFDYRNKDMEWGSAIDAPIRACEKLQGYCQNYKEETKS